MKERRQFVRKRCKLNIIFYTNENKMSFGGINVGALDLGEGGMMLEFYSDVKKGCYGNIEFTLNSSGFDHIVKTKILIKWNNKEEGRIGVKFVDLSEKDRIEIRNFIETL